MRLGNPIPFEHEEERNVELADKLALGIFAEEPKKAQSRNYSCEEEVLECDGFLTPQDSIEEEQAAQPELMESQPVPMLEGIEKAERFACHVPGCGKDYSKKCDLKKHIKKTHGIMELLARSDLKDKYAEQKEFSCPHSGCPASCGRKEELVRHLRKIHNEEPLPKKNRPYMCMDCQKRFTKKNHLNRHAPACNPKKLKNID